MPEPYWDLCLQDMVSEAIGDLIGDIRQKRPIWRLIAESPMCHDLWEFLQRFNAAGISLDESKVLHALLSNYFGDNVPKWLVFDILSQLRETQTRCQTLESAVDLISRSLFAFGKQIPETLPEYHDPLYSAHNSLQTRLDYLSAALRQHEANGCVDDDDDNDNNNRGPPLSVDKNGGTSGCPDKHDWYKMLTERIQALEEIVKENRNQLKSLPSIGTAEKFSAADTQESECAMQTHQSAFAALSDASESSTCTLTPASTAIGESVGEQGSMRLFTEAAPTALRLRICIYNDEISRHGHVFRPNHNILVRINPNTQFRRLRDELCKKYGDHTLSLSKSSSSYIFDSDTPTSLELEDNAKLTYATFLDGYETIDLTMD